LTLGSDYPVGKADPVGFVTRCSDISNAEKRMILSGSAHGLRKAGAAIAAENRATAPQLIAIFGWKTMKDPNFRVLSRSERGINVSEKPI
jgi:hypothetical protein